MSEKNNDRIDEMLEQVRSGNMDSTSMTDFDRMASKAQYDDLSELYHYQGKVSQSSRPSGQAETRYEYFMQSLDSVQYNSRLSASYRDGFQMALDRYIGKVDINRTNLSIVDKTLRQEMIRVGKDGKNYREMPTSLTSPLARHGYYDGLKLIEDLLDQSKHAMMKKAANAVLAVLARK